MFDKWQHHAPGDAVMRTDYKRVFGSNAIRSWTRACDYDRNLTDKLVKMKELADKLKNCETVPLMRHACVIPRHTPIVLVTVGVSSDARQRILLSSIKKFKHKNLLPQRLTSSSTREMWILYHKEMVGGELDQ